MRRSLTAVRLVPHGLPRKRFSAVPPAAASQATAQASTEDVGFFERHKWGLGFAAVVAAVGAYVYRSSRNTANHTAVKDTVEERAALDLDEIKDLRQSNETGLTVATFDSVSRSLSLAFPSRHTTYPNFAAHVQGYLEAPLVLGHLLDRVVLQLEAIARRDREAAADSSSSGGGSSSSSSGGNADKVTEYDCRLLMCVLSLALKTSSVEERSYALHQLLAALPDAAEAALPQPAANGASTPPPAVSQHAVTELLSFLVSTSQIPSEKLVAPTPDNLPFQTYKEPTPEELLRQACDEANLPGERFRPGELHEVLTSHAVCAWGSCAGKPKPKKGWW